MNQMKASQFLTEILMSGITDEGIESNVVSVSGTSCRTAFTTIVHLVTIKSNDVAVYGFVQKISTSLVQVMRYSQSAST